MTNSQQAWLNSFDNKANRIKVLISKGTTNKMAMGITFNDLIAHLKLGWEVYKEALQLSEVRDPEELSVTSRPFVFVDPSDLINPLPEKTDDSKSGETEENVEKSAPSKHKLSIEENAWWALEERYFTFAAHVCSLIRKHSKKDVPLGYSAHLKALSKMSGLPVKWIPSKVDKSKHPTLFAEAIMDALSLNTAEKENVKNCYSFFNLSHVLTRFETALRSSIEARQ